MINLKLEEGEKVFVDGIQVVAMALEIINGAVRGGYYNGPVLAACAQRVRLEVSPNQSSLLTYVDSINESRTLVRLTNERRSTVCLVQAIEPHLAEVSGQRPASTQFDPAVFIRLLHDELQVLDGRPSTGGGVQVAHENLVVVLVAVLEPFEDCYTMVVWTLGSDVEVE